MDHRGAPGVPPRYVKIAFCNMNLMKSKEICIQCNKKCTFLHSWGVKGTLYNMNLMKSNEICIQFNKKCTFLDAWGVPGVLPGCVKGILCNMNRMKSNEICIQFNKKWTFFAFMGCKMYTLQYESYEFHRDLHTV